MSKNNNLYYQVQRLRHTRNKLEKLNTDISEDSFYLKKIIIIQSAFIALVGIVYVYKIFL
jgi:hypothetical protein